MRPALDDAYIDEAVHELGSAGEVDHAVVAGAAGELMPALRRKAFDQHALHATDHALGNRIGLRLDLRLQALEARALHFGRDLIGQLGRWRSGARAVAEAIGIIELELASQLERGVELRVGLAGEADDEVRAHADAGSRRAQAPQDRAVLERRVAALHGGEDAIGARLHRQVYVRRELRQRLVRVD